MEVEIIKQCNPPITEQQRDALVRLLSATGDSIDEIALRAKQVVRHHTYGTIAFEHWITREEEEQDEIKARFDCRFCGTVWWGRPGSKCPSCFEVKHSEGIN